MSRLAANENCKGLTFGKDLKQFSCKYCQRDFAFVGSFFTIEQHIKTNIHMMNKTTYPERINEDVQNPERIEENVQTMSPPPQEPFRPKILHLKRKKPGIHLYEILNFNIFLNREK